MPARARRLAAEPLEARETPAVVGTLDPTFGTGGKFAGIPTAATIGGVAVDTAGRTVLAGSIPGAGGTDMLVVRLTPAGTPDTTFGTNGQTVIDFAGGNDQARGVAVDAAGNVVVAGTSGTELAFARLKAADGTLDTSFGGGGTGERLFAPSAGFNNIAANDVLVAPDGTIVAVGNSLSAGLTNSLMVVRLTPDGSMVSPGFNGGAVKLISFQFGLGSSTLGESVVLSGSDIVIGGQTNSNAAGATNEFAAIRLLSDGSFDPSFTGNLGSATALHLAAGSSDTAFGVAVDAAGNVYLTGSGALGATSSLGVVKLTPDGNPDPSFGTNGIVFEPVGMSEGDAIAVRPSGRVVVGGTFQASAAQNGFFVLQLTPTGQTDTTFNAAGTDPGVNSFGFDAATNAFVGDMAITPTGRIVLGGTDTAGGVRAARLIGSVEKDTLVAAGGAANGAASVFTPAPGTSQLGTPGVPVTSPFAGFTGDVRVATGDVNGDGVEDTILVTGAGTPTRMAVISGKDGSVLVPPTDPFGDPNFSAGAFVTAGDISGTGRADWVVTPQLTGGPRVVIFQLLANGTFDLNNGSLVANFFGIGDPSFRDGDRVSLGDVNGDGILDVFSIAAFNGGPRTALYDGKDVLVARGLGRDPNKLIGDFFASADGTDAGRGGRSIAVGDFNGDGVADLAVTGDNLLGTGNQITIYNGADLAANKVPGGGAGVLASFTVGSQPGAALVSLAAVDADGDNKADLVAGSGAGQPSLVRVYLGKTITTAGEPAGAQTLDPFGTSTVNGVFVG